MGTGACSLAQHPVQGLKLPVTRAKPPAYVSHLKNNHFQCIYTF